MVVYTSRKELRPMRARHSNSVHESYGVRMQNLQRYMMFSSRSNTILSYVSSSKLRAADQQCYACLSPVGLLDPLEVPLL